jgi:uncharacterized spore protein YtfJ
MEHASSPNLEKLTGAAKDTFTVRRVFGEPYTSGDALIIPVAKVMGGFGEGYGGGEDEKQSASGEGGGSGFGLRAKPAGVYRVRDGEVEWRPAIDVNKLALGGQILAAVVAVAVSTAWAVNRAARLRAR